MSNHASVLVSEEELSSQRGYMTRVWAEMGGGRYKIVTYGCQMNEHDSELLAGMLCEMGYTPTECDEEADVILFNTCCVRDNAERRVLGNIGALNLLKRQKPNLIIGVCGCMMQQEGVAEKLLRLRPYVDLVFGTHNLYRFPQLLFEAMSSGHRVLEVLNEEGRIAEHVPMRRVSSTQGYVTIMYGCNNFCSYCIVPYVRGRERSRSIADIVKEAQDLAHSGVQEIMLLGQNVNSFGKDGSTEESFPQLLHELDGVVPRIRFMTSHPKDLSDALIAEMARSQSVCPQFHLPVQSGNDRILAEMNRRYTRNHYLERVRTLRSAVPGLGLTTDIIVGFPGETEAEFEDTMSLVSEARYDSAFTFIYSPRQGTRAARMSDQIDEEVKHERLSRLIHLQEGITKEMLESCVGRVEDVLVESTSRRQEGHVSGRTKRGMTVNFAGSVELIGHIVPVHITASGANTLRGELKNKRNEDKTHESGHF